MDRNFDKQTIDCESFEDRIQDLMDRRIALDSDRLLCEHSDKCADCHSVLTSFQSLEAVLSQAFVRDCLTDADVSTPRDFHSSLSQWTVVGAIASLAALVLVVIAPMFNTPSNVITVADNNNSVTPLVEDAQEDIVLPIQKAPANHPNDMITMVSYDTIPPSLRNAYQYAAELPGIRPIECSVTVTIEALQKSWNTPSEPKEDKESPDLGQSHSGQENGLA